MIGNFMLLACSPRNPAAACRLLCVDCMYSMYVLEFIYDSIYCMKLYIRIE